MSDYTPVVEPHPRGDELFIGEIDLLQPDGYYTVSIYATAPVSMMRVLKYRIMWGEQSVRVMWFPTSGETFCQACRKRPLDHCPHVTAVLCFLAGVGRDEP